MLQQLFDRVTFLFAHLLENCFGPLVGQLGKQVSGGARIHLVQDFGHLLGVERFNQLLLRPELNFLKRLGRNFVV